jgi:peptide/nickel transport system permease protein
LGTLFCCFIPGAVVKFDTDILSEINIFVDRVCFIPVRQGGYRLVSYIVRRFFIAILTVIAISMLSFLIIQLPPGDYVTSYIITMSSSGSSVSEAEAEALRIQLGLDKPVYVQYLKWMGLIMQGNFGMAMEWGRPVKEVIGDRLTLTMIISLAAIVFTWALALPIGIYSAVKRYSVLDYIFTFVGFLGLAVPGFMLALIVMYAGFAWFGASVGGLFSADYAEAPWSFAKFIDLVKHLPTPAIVLGISGTAQMIRIMRSNLLDELRKPYVMTARARGLAESRVILKYPVRVAMNPFVSTIGYLLPYIVSGSIIVSMVLSLPTVGPLLLKALVAQDMFLAGTIVLLLGVLTVIGTFISDLLLMWVDPRIRLGRN